MRAQFVRHSENPLDTFDIGRTRERRLEKNSKEIKDLFVHLFPKYKISKYDILTAGFETGEFDTVGWKIERFSYAFFIKYTEMEDIEFHHYSSGYYRIKDNIIVDEFDFLTLEEAKEKLSYWIYKVRVFENINFERGQDPKDAMELGDVKGRKLKSIADILVIEFEKLFKKSRYLLPKFEVEYKETNVGFGNRDSWETDQIIVSVEYKIYYFALGWTGNPLNTEVPQKFSVKWAKLPEPGPSDISFFNTLNAAIYQLSEWIKNV